MTTDVDIPTVVTAAGLQPNTPATLLALLIALVQAVNPGYTANLPASLIEDVSSTDTYATILIDQARVETVNSLTPYGANEFLLSQLGEIYGVTLGLASNTSVYAVISGPPGFIIGVGFTVSDGTYQYIVTDGGIIGSDGSTIPLFCLATIPGSWPVPAGTVTQIVTSVPPTISLTVVNPETGTPGGNAETAASFRARVLQAGLAASQGMARYLKTLLFNVAGVQQRLVSVVQQTSGWEIIVGGGDPYQVAYAIWRALFDITSLVGSTLAVTGITNANPGVVTTDLDHGFSTGQLVNIAGVVGMTGVNNTPLTITVLTETTFSIGINTTSSGAYTSGGVVTPNFRNIVASINDFPDIYNVAFVNPPQQTVGITVTWNTSAPNFLFAGAVAQLGATALVDYVNAIVVGNPINLFELQAAFQAGIANVLPPQLLTRMVFVVMIDSVDVSPESGTGIIAGDPESYFYMTATGVTITQG